MNEQHAQLCPSQQWAAHMQTDVLPALASAVRLGEDMLEVGPGPGATTEWLRQRVTRLTAVELDTETADNLAARYDNTNVDVINGDACDLPFAADSFDSAGAFTMLHHVPTVALQNKALAEILRVLRPGAALIGSDSLPSNGLHHFHADDNYNPIEPGSFLTRLQTVGYAKITISVDGNLTFIAHKPAS